MLVERRRGYVERVGDLFGGYLAGPREVPQLVGPFDDGELSVGEFLAEQFAVPPGQSVAAAVLFRDEFGPAVRVGEGGLESGDIGVFGGFDHEPNLAVLGDERPEVHAGLCE